MTSAGIYYAQAFEEQCRDAMAKKLEQTSAFKKSLAGIATVSDAQAKCYAPSDTQIIAIATCIRDAADAAYHLPFFCEQQPDIAAKQLIEALELPIRHMNQRWQESKMFFFDENDLSDMLEQAKTLVSKAHDGFVKA